MSTPQKLVINNYIITVHSDGEITICGGYDTYIGWSGTLETAIKWVESQN